MVLQTHEHRSQHYRNVWLLLSDYRVYCAASNYFREVEASSLVSNFLWTCFFRADDLRVVLDNGADLELELLARGTGASAALDHSCSTRNSYVRCHIQAHASDFCGGFFVENEVAHCQRSTYSEISSVHLFDIFPRSFDHDDH